MSIQYVSSKWRRTAVLMRNRRARAYVPATSLFSQQSLQRMLNRYGMVYVKPDQGSHGTGVMRVEGRDGQYSFQSGTRKRSFSTLHGLYAGANKARSSRRQYLVQRGIHLRRYKGRRFDLRVMVQANPRGRWETTGILARVAGANRVVTNCVNGGSVVSLDGVSRGMGLSGRSRSALQSRLKRLGLITASAMLRRFPRVKELGLDVGLDAKLHPWLIEVNTSPDPFLFKQLKDRSAFRRIYSYAQAYGKYPARKSKSRKTRSSRRRN